MSLLVDIHIDQGPLIENAIWTDCSTGFTLVMTPIVPLHIPSSMRELLRNITQAPGCNRTDEGRFVLDLNICSEEAEFHWTEFTKSTEFKIRNLLLGTGSALHTILLIC